jgi:hypothetical protein
MSSRILAASIVVFGVGAIAPVVTSAGSAPPLAAHTTRRRSLDRDSGSPPAGRGATCRSHVSATGNRRWIPPHVATGRPSRLGLSVVVGLSNRICGSRICSPVRRAPVRLSADGEFLRALAAGRGPSAGVPHRYPKGALGKRRRADHQYYALLLERPPLASQPRARPEPPSESQERQNIWDLARNAAQGPECTAPIHLPREQAGTAMVNRRSRV